MAIFNSYVSLPEGTSPAGSRCFEADPSVGIALATARPGSGSGGAGRGGRGEGGAAAQGRIGIGAGVLQQAGQEGGENHGKTMGKPWEAKKRETYSYVTIMLLQYIYIGLFEWELYVDRIYLTILVNIYD